jgi:hypothetical protein
MNVERRCLLCKESVLSPKPANVEMKWVVLSLHILREWIQISARIPANLVEVFVVVLRQVVRVILYAK